MINKDSQTVYPTYRPSNTDTMVISTAITNAVGVYDSLVFSRIRDVIQKAKTLGLESKFMSNVFPKYSAEPVSMTWTKFPLKRIAKLLPFLNMRTVQRHTHSLEKKGLVYCAVLNKSAVDSTCWYAISTRKLAKVLKREEAQNER